jgi:hypothetical protein
MGKAIAKRRNAKRRNECLPAEFPARRRGDYSVSRRALAVIVAVLWAAWPLPVAAAPPTVHGFAGLCAYYAGRPAAHGGAMTAAHRTLPFGTRLRVTDPKTGRSVIVTINDRGPFGRHRVLDLSIAAARALGMINRGVIYVRAEVL